MKIKISISVFLLLLTTSCSMLRKKVDSDSTNTVPGFDYKYPKTGEWFIGSIKDGNILIGKKVEADGTSVLATVQYGPIGLTTNELGELKKTGKFKAHSPEEIISSFKTNLELDAKQGRVKNIKTRYEEKKYDKGRCLTFSQVGDDNGTMPMSNDGMWCMNSKTYSYIMLNISTRVPIGRIVPNLSTEKSEFFGSLIFIEK